MSTEEDPSSHSCSTESSRYPLDLRGEQYLRSSLRQLHELLQSEGSRLFNTSSSDIGLLETYEGDLKCQLKKISDVEKLRQALCLPNFPQSREPLSRHVFISARNSRDKLSCTLDMFQLLGSHHQVSPIFLDLLISFGAQNSPQDFHHTYFREESHHHQTRMPMDGDSSAQYGLGSREIKLCYKFQALEKTGGVCESWIPRQTAVYHSYALSTGRSFWITAKANNVIQERVTEESQQGVPLEAATSGDRSLAFATTLKMHLIKVEWASEGWRWYINDTGKMIREIILKAKDTGWVKELTSPGGTFYQGHRNNGLLSRITSWEARTKHKSSDPYERSASDQDFYENINLEEVGETLESLWRRSSIEDLQALSNHRNRLEEYRLAIELNIRNMVDLRQCYQRLYGSPDFPDDVHASCANTFAAFQNRIRSIERLLEGECLQIEALITQIAKIQKLDDKIVSRRETQLNHRTSQINWETSCRMERLAQRAGKDARSMHIITLFTLIFLPGTFLASFFSTPVFGAGDNLSGWTFHTDLFVLFVQIMVPMTFTVVCIWRFYMWLTERKGRTRVANPWI